MRSLHGNPDSSVMWDDVAGRLASNFPCCAPDLPGFGLSETPRKYIRSLDGLARFVEQFRVAARSDDRSISWPMTLAGRLPLLGRSATQTRSGAWSRSTPYSSATIAGISGQGSGAPQFWVRPLWPS